MASPISKFFWRSSIILILLTLICIGLIAFNGKYLASDETPLIGITSHAKSFEPPAGVTEIKIMAYNIAKGFVHKGGLTFEKPDKIVERLWQIVDLINKNQPDLVFLSETIFECGPSPINQILFLAKATRMHTWVFGENYNLGLPFYRIVGGNAILSRWPVTTVDNPSLTGRKPFYVTKNNRRILWGELNLNGKNILLGSVHTDSFNPTNNLAQTRQILEYLGEKPAIMAGDFNARPDEPSIRLIQDSGRFSGSFDDLLTFPAHTPEQTIDFIFAPADWKLIEHRVLRNTASDHLPIISTFSVPPEGNSQ